MKVTELLFEADESVANYTESMETLKGKTFEFNGTEYTITNVKHHKTYGNNYDIKVKPAFGDDHPYGPGKKVIRQIEQLTGLGARFSESGMQGKDHINVAVGKLNKKPPMEWKKGLQQMAELVKSRGFEVVQTNDNNVIVKRKGKGTFMFAYIPETDNTEEKISVQKWSDWGYSVITSRDTVEGALAEIDTGFASKYFKAPKTPKASKTS